MPSDPAHRFRVHQIDLASGLPGRLAPADKRRNEVGVLAPVGGTEVGLGCGGWRPVSVSTLDRALPCMRNEGVQMSSAVQLRPFPAEVVDLADAWVEARTGQARNISVLSQRSLVALQTHGRRVLARGTPRSGPSPAAAAGTRKGLPGSVSGGSQTQSCHRSSLQSEGRAWLWQRRRAVEVLVDGCLW